MNENGIISFPHSSEAEMAVLGAIIIDQQLLDPILDIIKSPDYFYSDNNKEIFETIIKIRVKDPSAPIDLVTLTNALTEKKILERVGGQKYLLELLDKVSTTSHSIAYANIVKDDFLYRQLMNIGETLISDASYKKSNFKYLIDKTESKILELSKSEKEGGLERADELITKAFERLETLYSTHSAITGVPSGFGQLDAMTAGFQPSDLIILAARPSMGKSALALNIIYNTCVCNPKKVPTALFSLEMDSNTVMQRFLGIGARTNLSQLRKGFFGKEAWEPLSNVGQAISESPLYIDSSTDINILDIRSRCRKLQSQLQAEDKKLGLVVIDYLQLIKGSGRFESRQQEVSEISRLLKDLARNLSVPVIALSQLSRKTEDKSRDGNRPKLSDLRESGAIEQDADLVALIHRPDYYNQSDPTIQGHTEIIIAKHRNGAIGTIELMFQKEFTRFSDLPINLEIPGDVIETEVKE